MPAPMKIPSFHDGYFEGLWIAPNKLVKFFLRTADEQSFVLTLEGVQALTFTNIKQGNIILDLVFRSCGSPKFWSALKSIT